MSKFHFHPNGTRQIGLGPVTVYDVTHVPTGKHLGLVARGAPGWSCWVDGTEESGYSSRQYAAERLLLVSGVNPVAWSALPADPFDGISA